MRALVLVLAALVVAGCGGERHAAPSCSLHRGADVSERTGEHTLVLVVVGCPVRAMPRVELLDGMGRRLAFAYVPVGGRSGTPQRVVLEKYRCDIRTTAVARGVRMTLADGRRLALRLGRQPAMDWCPAEAPSSVVRIYLGGVHAVGTFRDVFRDVYDGHLDRTWSCGVLRAAVAHLPVDGPMYSRLPGLLRAAAARACRTALAGLTAGAPRSAVVAALGQASRGGPHCSVWRWPPASGAVDGARVCFARDRAAVVQRALHG